MGDPCARHPAEPGNVGVIADEALPDQPIEMDGKGHEAGNAGNRIGWRGREFWSRPDGDFPSPALARLKWIGVSMVRLMISFLREF